MARRTAKETEALRAQIVDTALELFADRGIAATPITDVAREVGISKQALMHHFRTRQALEEAIIARLKEALDEMLPKFVAAFTAADPELDAILIDLMAALDAQIHLARFILRQIAFDPQPDIPPAGNAIAALCLDFLRQGQQDGTFRDDFRPEDTLFNLGMMILTSHAAARHRSPHEPDVPFEALRLRRNRDLIRIVRLAVMPV